MEKQYSYKLFIPKDITAKINHLLLSILNIEWSGILYYTYKGSLAENNLELEVKDILLLDIGSTAATEFDITAEVIAYQTQVNPELDWQMGLVH